MRPRRARSVSRQHYAPSFDPVPLRLPVEPEQSAPLKPEQPNNLTNAPPLPNPPLRQPSLTAADASVPVACGAAQPFQYAAAASAAACGMPYVHAAICDAAAAAAASVAAALGSALGRWSTSTVAPSAAVHSLATGHLQ